MNRKVSLIWTGIIIPIFWIHTACGGGHTTNHDLRKKAYKMHHQILILDTHCDTPSQLLRKDWDIFIQHTNPDRRNGKIDIPRMEIGGLDAAFFAVFINQGPRTANGYKNAFQMANTIIDSIESMAFQRPDRVTIAKSPEDIYYLEKQGKRAICLGLENGYSIGKNIKNIQHFYNRGIRYITLCHTSNNDICDSSTDSNGPEWKGLSPFGVKVVHEMNRFGMMIDVSHISDEAFYDVLVSSKAPVIASHSCSRAIYNNPRNLTDDMIRALSHNEGVVQINLCSFYLTKLSKNPERDKEMASLKKIYGSYYNLTDPERKERYLDKYSEIDKNNPGEKASISNLVDHIDHVVNIVGIDHDENFQRLFAGVVFCSSGNALG